MASSIASESHYFPALDKCLTGEVILTSWRTAYNTLRDEPDNSSLQNFLQDPETIRQLGSVLDQYAKPSSRSASEFETKTAPIHLAQSNESQIDVEELKEDARWLSKELEVDEVQALRLAVLERQGRASASLLSRSTNDATSSHAQSTTSFRASISVAAESPSTGKCGPMTTDSRRAALLETYLTEKASLLKLSACLASRCAVSRGQGLGYRPGALSVPSGPSTWVEHLEHRIIHEWSAGATSTGIASFCEQIIVKLELLLDTTEDGRSWPAPIIKHELAQIYIKTCFVEVGQLLRLLLASLYTLQGITPASLVTAWYSFMRRMNFLQESRRVFTNEGFSSSLLQLLASVISLEILKAELVIEDVLSSIGSEVTLSKRDTYLGDAGCLKTVSEAFRESALMGSSIAGPAMLAWATVIGTIQDNFGQVEEGTESYASANSPWLDAIYQASDFLKSESVEDPFRWFAASAVDGLRVMDVVATLASSLGTLLGSSAESPLTYICKEVLFEAFKHSVSLIQYGEELLEVLIALLTPCGNDDVSKLHVSILAGRILTDHTTSRYRLRDATIDQALARYPHELSPAVRLLTILASARGETAQTADLSVSEMLDDLKTSTIMVPETFTAYELEHENLNENEMILTEDFSLFVSKQEYLTRNSGRLLQSSSSSRGADAISSTTLIAAGASGIIVKEPRPFVLKLTHQHSGLEYLGLLLFTFMPNSDLIAAAPGATLNRVTAAEVIALFTALLDAANNGQDGANEARHLLGRLSYALGDQHDIVGVIAEVFEAELMGFLDQNPQEGSLELVVACAEFFGVLAKCSPERVWSTLARSSLLGVADGAASLASVVGSAEIVSGRYHFLTACTRLLSNLLDDAVTGIVKRKSHASKARSSRFQAPQDLRNSTPERTMSIILNTFFKIVLDVVQSIPEWKFTSTVQRSEILVISLRSFEKALTCTFGLAASVEPAFALSSVLFAAAETLQSLYAPQEGSSPIFDTVARLLPDGLLATDDIHSDQARAGMVKQTQAVLSFLIVFARSVDGTSPPAQVAASQSSSEAGRSTTKRSPASKRALSLATGLLKNMPTFASLLAADQQYRALIYPLLTELITITGSVDADPPSILGHLNPQAAQDFLVTVTRFDRPLASVQGERKVWDFFSAVISGKQQWIGIFLLTGRLPKTRNSGGDHEKIKGKTVLAIALDQLCNIANLAPDRALGILKFVALAQQTLVWSTQQLRSHPEFLRRTVTWLDNLKDTFKEPATSTDAQARRAKEHAMAAYLCDILAINVHASMETGDKTVLRGLIPRLAFLRDFGVAVDGYNRSLHKTLADNLSRKFPQCGLSDFVRIPSQAHGLGQEYFYDRNFAASVLGYDASWTGSGRGGNSGFSDEVARANVNLSLLHAQMQLLRSWKTLATTLCECADQDPTLHTAAAKIAEKCLLANAVTQLTEPCMPEALELRTELAFVITSRLVALRVDGPYMKDLLPAAWELVSSSPVDYEIATAPEDVQYYRRLLQVLYLTVQPHSYMVASGGGTSAADSPMEYLPASTSSYLVNIVGKIVVPGFRALCGNLHNDIGLALPTDFGLLTALLQAIVSVPGTTSVQTLLSDIIASSSIVRGALSLYSWSDQLAEVTGADPIYGEAAMTFLLALSTIRPIAEQMALDGVLVQLSAANLSNYYRKANGKGPFDEPVRMFSMWTDGYLPLCLNLLDAVGPPIAAEVAIFLNTFPEQLARVSRSFENERPGPRNPHGGAITLGMVSEAHSLSMIALIVKSDIARGAAEGVNAADIPELTFDLAGIKANVDSLWRNKRALRDRITPTTPLEARWHKSLSAGTQETTLEMKVMKEMAAMLACFGSEGEE